MPDPYGGGCAITYDALFKTQDPVDKVIAFYQEQLEKAGLKVHVTRATRLGRTSMGGVDAADIATAVRGIKSSSVARKVVFFSLSPRHEPAPGWRWLLALSTTTTGRAGGHASAETQAPSDSSMYLS
jgi:hypothetical protein